jgi:L-asparaginase II
MASKQPLIIEILRGPVVESIHQVMAVVVNEHGGVVTYWGNPNFLTLPRSAIKPLQALSFVESGAMEKFALDSRHLSLACSSHGGEQGHLTVLKEWLDKLALSENILACGPQWPRNELATHEMIRRGLKPSAICNNCSGKHLGIISTCLHLGEDPKNYQQYEHISQKRMRKVLSEVTKIDHSQVAQAIDGCGLPTYALPLQGIAVGMSALLNQKEQPVRKAAAKKILEALKNQPKLMSGSGEFAASVIEKTGGRAFVKGGAEGVFTGLIPGKGIAFAIKAADGSSRAAQLAAAHLLSSYGGVTESEAGALSEFWQPPVKNSRGETVGQMRIAKPS